jgi:hypothetical protein
MGIISIENETDKKKAIRCPETIFERSGVLRGLAHKLVSGEIRGVS